MNNQELLEELVYGHKNAKKILRVVINRSQERYFKKCVEGRHEYPDRLNCLLVGPSGTGKTFLIKSMAKLHKFPLLCIDATDLMPTGNDTGINKKQLKKLILDTASDYTKKPEYNSLEGVLNQMVVFVDEFDKLGVSFDSSGNWNKHVQASFLTMIENNEELSGVTWIFAGAFSALYSNRIKPKSIGFFPDTKEEPKAEGLSDAEIVKAGIIPEMMGRIPLIVELDSFTLGDYTNIVEQLMSNKYSMLTNVNAVDIAQKALDSGQGVRSITRQLEMALIDHEAETPWVMPTF